MSREKIITKTIITGYVYDVIKRNGEQLAKVAEVIVPSPIRSIKQQSQILIDNKYSADHVLMLNRTEEKQYTMTEADFIRYSTVVTAVEQQPAAEQTDASAAEAV
jgi:hypothetical protein